ncbi:hypothetical protein PM082_006675 [Marasmius tenuissimus]|nr:hypothetical protein PM082_006675 [Marasmius tenuissimus]
MAAVSQVIITYCLWFSFKAHIDEASSTPQPLLQQLSFNIVARGGILTLAQLFVIILYLAKPDRLWWTPIHQVLPPLYYITTLMTLNIRGTTVYPEVEQTRLPVGFPFSQGDDIADRIFVPTDTTTLTGYNHFATSSSTSICYPNPVLLDLCPLRRGFNATVRSDFGPHEISNPESCPDYTIHSHSDSNTGGNLTDPSPDEKNNLTDVDAMVGQQDQDTGTLKNEDEEENVPETRPRRVRSLPRVPRPRGAR